MDNVCFIGGSPCSGKSTVAKALADICDMVYYSVDDHLGKYIAQGLNGQIPLVRRMMAMSADETWLRDPKEQCAELLEYFCVMFPFALRDIRELGGDKNIIAEGAALLPTKMREIDIARYFCMIPTREFQIRHYRERPWVNDILKDSSNRETAFAHWMERDALMGEITRRDAARRGYISVIVDGEKSAPDMVGLARTILRL